ncbi:hypothetical protein [Xanthobacter flavus]|uniref:hypothetical protein n=1 Tax=Xanthobacter flavus TaxID=281 RepID=UPI0037279F82
MSSIAVFSSVRAGRQAPSFVFARGKVRMRRPARAATAFFPEAWLYLFSAEPAMVATGSAYLRGLALYFAALSVALIVYAATILTAVKTGAWLR